ncbi:MAG TPA: hydrogenase maturation nickel metallochaperone HypA [Deltaproteobacteria bacterium]|nr:hydrogenase maturation nickel metallochaperone HypA [Deltaproteobacteria bacterium]
MHEFSLAARIVGIAAERAARGGNASKPRIDLIIDEMSGYSAQRLAIYLEFLCEEAGLAGAGLTVTTAKARMECPDCGVTFERQRFALACPACQGMARPSPATVTLFIDHCEISAQTSNPLFPFVYRPEQKKVVHPTPTPQGPHGSTFFCDSRKRDGGHQDR